MSHGLDGLDYFEGLYNTSCANSNVCLKIKGSIGDVPNWQVDNIKEFFQSCENGSKITSFEEMFRDKEVLNNLDNYNSLCNALGERHIDVNKYLGLVDKLKRGDKESADELRKVFTKISFYAYSKCGGRFFGHRLAA